IDLRPEETRREGLYASLRRRKARFLAELRAAGGLDTLRAQRSPAREAWWWFLDEELAQERRRRLRRWGLLAGILALVLITAGALIYWVARPDPVVLATNRNLNQAQDYALKGQWAEAIPFLEENIRLDPQNAEWHIRLGVLAEISGDTARAREAFSRGRQLTGDEAVFLIERSQYYNEINAFAQALADAEEAVRLDPDSAIAYLMMGRALAGLQRYPEAVTAYQQAVALAEKADPTLYVTAKVELGYLLQSLSASTPASP
ncbi:MAG: tetratricopeptide repeat protein, partial [Anaerolineae bacterium]